MKSVIVLFESQTLQHAGQLIAAAQHSGACEITAIVFGDPGAFKTLPIQKGFVIPTSEFCLAQEQAVAIRLILAEYPADLVLLYGDCCGNAVAPLLWDKDVSCSLNITEIKKEDEKLVLVSRGAYALNLVAEHRMFLPAVCSIAEDTFTATKEIGTPVWVYTEAASHAKCCLERNIYLPKQEETVDYPIVFIGGRGIGSKANAEKLMHLAKQLGVGVGATRPAVYNGWFPYEMLIGASGKRISPELCITFGASGCAAFLRGIEKSEKIISINNDRNAAIFEHSDIGIIADCNKIIDRLIVAIESVTKKEEV